MLKRALAANALTGALAAGLHQHDGSVHPSPPMRAEVMLLPPGDTGLDIHDVPPKPHSVLRHHVHAQASRSNGRRPLNDQYWFGSYGLDTLSAAGQQNARLAYDLSKHESWFSTAQVACLDDMWWRENKFEVGNGGIPQAKPEGKMATEGADWATNPVTQERWGLHYIQQRYITPCDAWESWQQKGWY